MVFHLHQPNAEEAAIGQGDGDRLGPRRVAAARREDVLSDTARRLDEAGAAAEWMVHSQPSQRNCGAVRAGWHAKIPSATHQAGSSRSCWVRATEPRSSCRTLVRCCLTAEVLFPYGFGELLKELNGENPSCYLAQLLTLTSARGHCAGQELPKGSSPTSRGIRGTSAAATPSMRPRRSPRTRGGRSTGRSSRPTASATTPRRCSRTTTA